MMKKTFSLLTVLVLLGIGYGTQAAVNTSKNCLEVPLDNGDRVCVGMEKSGTTYKVSLKESTFSTSPTSLVCNIALPNDENDENEIKQISRCEGEFTCSSSLCKNNQEIQMDVRTNKTWGMLYGYYDFSNGKWTSSSDGGSTCGGGSCGGNNNGGGSTSNNYLDLISNNTYPNINSYVDLTIETNANYRGKVNFEMQYRSTSSSSWKTVSNSSYYSAGSQFDNGYTFTSSDSGYKRFSSFISFAKEGYYRVYAEDEDGNEDYLQFYVEGDDNSDNNSLAVSTNNTYPTTNQYIDLTVETNTNYRGYIDFAVEYRSSSSSYRSTLSKSSSDITIDNYFKNGYQMTSSDYGHKTLYSIIKFNRTGQYRITVSDDNRNERTLTIYVDSSNSSNNSDKLTISSNTLYPSIDDYIKITVETDRNYRGYVDFTLQYRSSTSNSWSNSSSNYYTASSYFQDGYQFTSSDYGYHSFSSFIRFSREGYYRLYVRDNQGNEDYINLNVDANSSSSSVKGFSTSELKKVTAVSQIWDSVINRLKNKSYSLRNDSYRSRLSDTFYNNMRDVIRDVNNRTFGTYSDFFSAFNDWMSYTTRNA